METKAANRTSNKIISLFKKFLLALCVVCLFSAPVLIVRGDYKNFRDKLSKVPLFSFLITARNGTFERSKMQTLNYYIPSFGYLASFINTPQQNFDQGSIGNYLTYYRKAAEYMPENPNIQGMLGFLYYHSGKTALALKHTKKAAKLNPYYFWFPYNAGIISFKDGRYEESAKYLQQALTTRKDITIKILNSSKIYQQIIASSPNSFNFSVKKRIQKGTRQCIILLSLINQHLNNNKNIPEIPNLHLTIF